MKICCLSDTHGYLPDVPDCDLLVLAGDYCRDHRDRHWYVHDFCMWLAGLSARTSVVGVAGNHDFVFQRDPAFAAGLPWRYLCDSGTMFRGLKVWGSPWQPVFHDWAFNLPEEELAKQWAMIPDDTDVLVLHGPPHGYGDAVPPRHRKGDDDTLWPEPEHVGSPSLLARILAIQPRLVVAGHIHSGHGVYRIGETVFVNAAYVGEDYRPSYKPVVVEL